MELPLLDLSHFASGTELQRGDFAQLLVNSLLQYGFFRLINHGFSEPFIEELFDRVNFV